MFQNQHINNAGFPKILFFTFANACEKYVRGNHKKAKHSSDNQKSFNNKKKLIALVWSFRQI